MSFQPSDEEDKYFALVEAQKRQELRERMEKAAREAQEVGKVAELTGGDAAVAERIRALGFDGDTARVFDLLPLVHVAWADGSVQESERNAVVQILAQRGIEPGSEAALLIEALLEQRPSQAFLDETLELLRLIGAKDGRSATIVELCVQVAEAAGGFFGLGNKIGAEERALIERIAKGLGETAVKAVEGRLR